MRPFLLLMLAFGMLTIAQAETLRVMSYNIRFPNKDDGENYWDNRREAALAMLRQTSPDLIGTQELFFRQGEDIVSALPQYQWLGNSREGVHRGEYMGIFFLKDRFELLEMGQFWLSETPDRPASMSWGVSLPRMVTWVRLSDKRTGKAFYFLDTHFAHRAQDESARAASAKVIAAFLAKLPKETPLILTGDFNTTPGKEAYQTITSYLSDAWEKAAERKGPVGTFHGFRGGEKPEGRIDWILYRAPWKVAHAETIVMHEGAKYPSDHYPVIADFVVQ
ncbi:MAG: endonuclease/exonuclease/phosphatase family protein [Bryobacterales bacterium]|nr:endonuclease/exonuclease/phosphatase family protein [Bryobacterales bacterium]